MHGAGPSSRAGPPWMGCAWLLIIAALCLLLHFASLGHTWSERQVMLVQEDKGSKAGEPKPQSCPPHLISEITALGAVAKPAANHGSLQPGTEKRCRPGLGAAVLLASACLPVWAALAWEPVGAGLWSTKWNRTFHLNLPLLMSHCPQLLLLLLSCRNVFSWF